VLRELVLLERSLTASLARVRRMIAEERQRRHPPRPATGRAAYRWDRHHAPRGGGGPEPIR